MLMVSKYLITLNFRDTSISRFSENRENLMSRKLSDHTFLVEDSLFPFIVSLINFESGLYTSRLQISFTLFSR